MLINRRTFLNLAAAASAGPIRTGASRDASRVERGSSKRLIPDPAPVGDDGMTSYLKQLVPTEGGTWISEFLYPRLYFASDRAEVSFFDFEFGAWASDLAATSDGAVYFVVQPSIAGIVPPFIGCLSPHRRFSKVPGTADLTVDKVARLGSNGIVASTIQPPEFWYLDGSTLRPFPKDTRHPKLDSPPSGLCTASDGAVWYLRPSGDEALLGRIGPDMRVIERPFFLEDRTFLPGFIMDFAGLFEAA
jgi:hypothetical protein